MNVKIANQNTGVMSTPKAGGICPLTSLSKGSDGQATIAQGNSLRLVSGYQDATTRHSIAKDCGINAKEKTKKSRVRALSRLYESFRSRKISKQLHSSNRTMKFKNGPSTVAVGFTQASVSASKNPLPELTATLTVSEREEAIVGSIIDKDDDALGRAMGDVGATKADASLINNAITQHKTTVRRYILLAFCFRNWIRSGMKLLVERSDKTFVMRKWQTPITSPDDTVNLSYLLAVDSIAPFRACVF